MNRRELLSGIGGVTVASFSGCLSPLLEENDDTEYDENDTNIEEVELISIEYPDISVISTKRDSDEDSEEDTFTAELRNDGIEGEAWIGFYWMDESAADENEDIDPQTLTEDDLTFHQSTTRFFEEEEVVEAEFTGTIPDDRLGFWVLTSPQTIHATVSNTGLTQPVDIVVGQSLIDGERHTHTIEENTEETIEITREVTDERTNWSVFLAPTS